MENVDRIMEELNVEIINVVEKTGIYETGNNFCGENNCLSAYGYCYVREDGRCGPDDKDAKCAW